VIVPPVRVSVPGTIVLADVQDVRIAMNAVGVVSGGPTVPVGRSPTAGAGMSAVDPVRPETVSAVPADPEGRLATETAARIAWARALRAVTNVAGSRATIAVGMTVVVTVSVVRAVPVGSPVTETAAIRGAGADLRVATREAGASATAERVAAPPGVDTVVGSPATVRAATVAVVAHTGATTVDATASGVTAIAGTRTVIHGATEVSPAGTTAVTGIVGSSPVGGRDVTIVRAPSTEATVDAATTRHAVIPATVRVLVVTVSGSRGMIADAKEAVARGPSETVAGETVAGETDEATPVTATSAVPAVGSTATPTARSGPASGVPDRRAAPTGRRRRTSPRRSFPACSTGLPATSCSPCRRRMARRSLVIW
jgi:hypothetical protein